MVVSVEVSLRFKAILINCMSFFMIRNTGKFIESIINYIFVHRTFPPIMTSLLITLVKQNAFLAFLI